MSELVRYEREGEVSILTMDDGKMNVMSVAMLGALGAAFDRAQAEGTVVLLTGRGSVFSAGFDLAVFKQGKPAALAMLSAGARITERLLAFPAPVVAAVNGHAIAMGAFLMLSADLRIGVSNSPQKIQANEVHIGMTVPRFATEVLRQRLVPAHFNRAAILGDSYGADEAVQAGFLDQAVPAAEFDARARERAQALARLVRANHAATKLRARNDTLAHLRRAVEADIADWSAQAA